MENKNEKVDITHPLRRIYQFVGFPSLFVVSLLAGALYMPGTVIQFQHLPDYAFFRRPGNSTVYRKVPVHYESTKEVNMQTVNGTFHLANWDVLCIRINENDPIPTKEELKNELPRPKEED